MTTAFQFFFTAAIRGSSLAALYAASCLENGLGIAQNKSAAEKLLKWWILKMLKMSWIALNLVSNILFIRIFMGLTFCLVKLSHHCR